MLEATPCGDTADVILDAQMFVRCEPHMKGYKMACGMPRMDEYIGATSPTGAM